MIAKEEKVELSEEDVDLLNSKLGMKKLFSQKKINLRRAISYAKYEYELQELQKEMIILLNWVINHGEKVVVLFEGRDAAGKGGMIRRATEHLNPRNFRIVALPKPTEEERGQWYFQRYINQLPSKGELVFFDRSWYNRAVVEPVNEFCTKEEYERFVKEVNLYEEMIINSGIRLIKIYFSIDKREQAKRFEDIKSDPLKRWKITPVDLRAQELWEVYTQYKKKMFAHSNTEIAPWKIIKANKKTEARVAAIQYILSCIPYTEEKVVKSDYTA